MARVVVDVMLKSEILDPQGEAVLGALPRLGVNNVKSVRIGKRVEIEFDDAKAESERSDDSVTDIEEQSQIIADQLLANPVIENFTVSVLDGNAA
ncbi:MAG TPA: phosphoribosylformylglycinamidine synthase subunit PurS [Glycomyces sp.]|nr:phosphoribosylformylglycinamidine synthase subunit PurS [Glycomyces sp.]